MKFILSVLLWFYFAIIFVVVLIPLNLLYRDLPLRLRIQRLSTLILSVITCLTVADSLMSLTLKVLILDSFVRLSVFLKLVIVLLLLLLLMSANVSTYSPADVLPEYKLTSAYLAAFVFVFKELQSNAPCTLLPQFYEKLHKLDVALNDLRQEFAQEIFVINH